MTVLYLTPWWLAIFLIVAAFVAVSCAGHILVRRTFAKLDFIQHNEVAGFIIAVVGVLYAVLLAFITVVVWERFAVAENNVSQEVDAATDVWRLGIGLKPDDRERIDDDLTQYSKAILYDEWPKMRRGERSDLAQRHMSSLFGHVARIEVPTLRESNIQNHLLDRVQTMADLRRRRINTDSSGVPGVLWLALFIGAATVIGFEYLFGLQNFIVQLLMTAATATVIGLSFAVVIELDYPFRGDISVSPERWAIFYDDLRHSREPLQAR